MLLIASFFHNTKTRVAVLSSALKHFLREKPTVLRACVAKLKDVFYNCDICEDEAVQALAYLFSEGAKELCSAHTARAGSTDTHVYNKIWQVVVNTFIPRFLTKNMSNKHMV